MMESILLYSMFGFIAILGLVLHFLLDMLRIKNEEGKTLSIKQYWQLYPIQSCISIVSCLVGYIILLISGQFDPEVGRQLAAYAAFSVGYMSNSIADKIGKRGIERL